MKQILGNVIFFILLLTNLNANIVTTKLSAPAIYKGESVDFILTAKGEKVKFPNIKSIGGYDIQDSSSSQSTTIINGNITRSVSKIYHFSPKKSIVIPSYEVVVDGKTYKSKKLKIQVLKKGTSKNGSEFILNVSVDKKSAFVGEGINLTISLKQRIDADAYDIKLDKLKLEDFWIKKSSNITKSREKNYIVQKVHYQLFPQKSGDYTIPSLSAAIGKIVKQKRGGSSIFDDPFFDDPFFNSLTKRVKYKKIFSNEVKLHIKPLPNNLELYGKFSIKSSVDKKKVYANKPVNLTIKITGEGNIDDIKKFDIQLPNAVVYADEPKIDTNIVNDKYIGEFKEKVAIIADRNFTIPSISLQYFDKDSNKTKTIKTKPIDIEVIGGSKQIDKQQSNLIQNSQNVNKKENSDLKTVIKYQKNDHLKYLFLIMGIAIGLLIGYIFNKLKNRVEQKELNILKSIKKAKNDKELFDVLLPYSQKSNKISKILQKLEENIYKNGQNKIDKRDIIDYFEEYEDD